MIARLLAALGVVASCRTAAPPAAPRQTVETPCFPGPPLLASTIFYDLERQRLDATFNDPEHPPPPEAYGSCRVAKGVVTSADGRAVAQLNCGILVEAPGLVDHVGLQVGASARQVIDRHRDPEQRLTCVGGAGGETQCWFRPPADHDEPIARYTVRATPPQPVLEGREAVAFFAAQTILRFSLTMYCH